MWCCIEPARVEKTARIMKALAAGCGGRVCTGAPPDDGEVFAIWGHKFVSEAAVPKAHRGGRPYWFIDNGYWMPAKGLETGYYSLTYRGLWPVELEKPDLDRLRAEMGPWIKRPHGYVLLALPGMAYGGMLGFDMPAWAARIQDEIRKHTGKRIVVRDKKSPRLLVHDLSGASVVVTHSSKVAVDAVLEGVPCIVAPTNPAAPVCGTDLKDIDHPPMPDREKWWASLMCQQFTIAEMRDGTAAYWMAAIREQVDGVAEIHG